MSGIEIPVFQRLDYGYNVLLLVKTLEKKWTNYALKIKMVTSNVKQVGKVEKHSLGLGGADFQLELCQYSTRWTCID